MLNILEKFLKTTASLVSKTLNESYKDKYLVIENFPKIIHPDKKIYAGKFIGVTLEAVPFFSQESYVSDNVDDIYYILQTSEFEASLEAESLKNAIFKAFDDEDSAKLYAELE